MMERIYLDYCATTPVHPQVRAAMLPALEGGFGNPSSMHWAGREAAQLMDQARLQIATGIGCLPAEVYFTSGATEADNLALLGVLRPHDDQKTHLITSSVEHHAILHTAKALERLGCTATYLPVDSQGLVDPHAVRTAIRPETRLISVMMVNNEVGAVQPVVEIGQIARQHGILFHTDAVQAVGLFDLDLQRLPVDLLSLSAHKIYGPKGIGALYVRQGVKCSPIAFGGPQEGGLRPGTENIPGMLGLGAAMDLVCQHRAINRERLSGLRQRLIAGLHREIPGLSINGPSGACAPHIVSASFPGADAELMLLRLNAQGIGVSMGSACTSQAIEPSHVLSAMGLSHSQIEGTLRISLGLPTTIREIERFVECISEVYRRSQAG